MVLKKAASTFYSVIGSTRSLWQPASTHFPYSGFGALLLASAGVVVSVAILLASDGDDINAWKFQPTVYISIASTVTNITVAYALFEGLNVAWWHKALKDGTVIGNLHRIWAFGNSVLAAIFCGRHINMIAIASIFVALCPINGPLLQRASTISNATVTSQQGLDLQVNKLIPRGFTGIVTSRSDSVNMLTSNFSTTARAYYGRSPIKLDSACTGTCKANVLGAGFYVNCASYEVRYNVSGGSYDSPTVFGAWVEYAVFDNPTTFNLNVQIKPKAGCTGNLAITNCTLQGGSVKYPVVIDGSTSTVGLDPATTIWDDTVVGDLDALTSETHLGGTTTYGGLFLALANQYNTDLQFQIGGAIGWEFFGAQSESSIAYAHDVGGQPTCDVYFTDPLADFLQGARELIFRTAVATANGSDTQSVVAQASGSHTVYKTSHVFLAIATLVSALAILSVLLTFNGFWRLGRKVSMSPLETAKAFDAPIMKEADSSAPTKALLNQVGGKPVKYGLVNDSAGFDREIALPHSDSGFNSISGSDIEMSGRIGTGMPAGAHLELADPKRVTTL
ncbi:hypothetical protein LTR96_010466 [Exophiala xenobiotica]|nr:hypothetical protein LTR92_005513 [Exophiala xenobiotica]KAK5264195.1 hypothetical protein LTR96_010466 [Exophiala xenobiotica]KAK5333447.1 hypothetical protein LTR98_010422 [Exophiala xenobiotica]KAK5360571.1 hypothetical protein LTS13_010134 [Exophiala xenobiotica]KAK5414330.1 hypothetical protein LTR06_004143 [Exophiala xenobiotica]